MWSMAIDLWRNKNERLFGVEARVHESAMKSNKNPSTMCFGFAACGIRAFLSQQIQLMHQLYPLEIYIYLNSMFLLLATGDAIFASCIRTSASNNEHWWPSRIQYAISNRPIVHRRSEFICILLVRDLQPHAFIQRTQMHRKCNKTIQTGNLLKCSRFQHFYGTIRMGKSCRIRQMYFHSAITLNGTTFRKTYIYFI